MAAQHGMASAGDGGEGLQDVMLAMDVVDTLRHADQLVDRELDTAGRRERLVERLRQIYTAQGIEVTDDVLREGVLALEQERFAYVRSGSGLARFFAGLYVGRRRWLKPLVFLAVAGGFAWSASYGIQSLVGSLPEGSIRSSSNPRLDIELRRVYTELLTLTEGQGLVNRLEALHLEGTSAIERGDTSRARDVLREMQALRDTAAVAYDLRVVNEPGVRSGVFRIPDVNEEARNYYLIVEPVDRLGRPVSVTVRNEEDGKSYPVKRYGLRVSEATFNAVAADKQDDGIIQDNLVGRKYPGQLEPEFFIDTTGAAITRW
ncbi:MAG: DUF6384 family protein [Pseudomonadota bacterium]